ncbi:MAG: DUF3488 and transglutaminase-like domain-containing protein [Pseudomonadota bacterium]
MSVAQQIPRNALVWIIICLFALVAPHVPRLPLWVLGVYVLAVSWRIMVYRGRWSFPGRWIKVAMTLSGCFGIYVSYGTLIGLEPTVALLLTAFALKLIELSQRKDAYVLLFLGYFICITEYLFSQDLLITLYSVLNVLLVTTALVALHQPGEHQFNRRTMRVAGVMLLQAVPMMLVLFFVFPRIGPLWSVPLMSHTAKTGMSDFMKPGDVAKLSQSDEVAFRVSFEGEIPPKSELYWRGLVMSKLDRGTWSALGYWDVPPDEQRGRDVDVVGAALEYTVIMEPSQQNWLYGLQYARGNTPGILHASDFRMYSPVPIEGEYLYRVKSWPQTPIEREISPWRRRIETSLPPERNPRTQQLSRRMHAAATNDSDYVSAVLSMFREQPFVYTLKPGLLPQENPLDAFVFDSQRGFCEHYASTFVFMMRAAGVPARVVAGYQGGEINPTNQTVIVHQFDAHAWAEVWLPGEGWRRVDPTAAVSPTRIEFGLEEALQEEGSFLADSPLSPLRYRKIPLINQLRYRYDALTYRWQSWVVGFDNKTQFQVLQDMFGEVSGRMFATVLLGSWALVFIPVAISLLRRKPTRVMPPVDQYYVRFCRQLARIGLAREQGEAPGPFGRRVEAALPAYADQVERITGLYTRISYAGERPSRANASEEEEEFIRLVKRFRPERRRNTEP